MSGKEAPSSFSRCRCSSVMKSTRAVYTAEQKASHQPAFATQIRADFPLAQANGVSNSTWEFADAADRLSLPVKNPWSARSFVA